MFNQDEKMLVSIYGGRNRQDLLDNLRTMRRYLRAEESDLRLLTDAVLQKAEAMSDEAYKTCLATGYSHDG